MSSSVTPPQQPARRRSSAAAGAAVPVTVTATVTAMAGAAATAEGNRRRSRGRSSVVVEVPQDEMPNAGYRSPMRQAPIFTAAEQLFGQVATAQAADEQAQQAAEIAADLRARAGVEIVRIQHQAATVPVIPVAVPWPFPKLGARPESDASSQVLSLQRTLKATGLLDWERAVIHAQLGVLFLKLRKHEAAVAELLRCVSLPAPRKELRQSLQHLFNAKLRAGTLDIELETAMRRWIDVAGHGPARTRDAWHCCQLLKGRSATDDFRLELLNWLHSEAVSPPEDAHKELAIMLVARQEFEEATQVIVGYLPSLPQLKLQSIQQQQQQQEAQRAATAAAAAADGQSTGRGTLRRSKTGLSMRSGTATATVDTESEFEAVEVPRIGYRPLSTSHSIPAFSFGAPFKPERPSDIPGPGQYSIATTGIGHRQADSRLPNAPRVPLANGRSLQGSMYFFATTQAPYMPGPADQDLPSDFDRGAKTAPSLRSRTLFGSVVESAIVEGAKVPGPGAYTPLEFSRKRAARRRKGPLPSELPVEPAASIVSGSQSLASASAVSAPHSAAAAPVIGAAPASPPGLGGRPLSAARVRKFLDASERHISEGSAEWNDYIRRPFADVEAPTESPTRTGRRTGRTNVPSDDEVFDEPERPPIGSPPPAERPATPSEGTSEPRTATRASSRHESVAETQRTALSTAGDIGVTHRTGSPMPETGRETGRGMATGRSLGALTIFEGDPQQQSDRRSAPATPHSPVRTGRSMPAQASTPVGTARAPAFVAPPPVDTSVPVDKNRQQLPPSPGPVSVESVSLDSGSDGGGRNSLRYTPHRGKLPESEFETTGGRFAFASRFGYLETTLTNVGELPGPGHYPVSKGAAVNDGPKYTLGRRIDNQKTASSAAALGAGECGISFSGFGDQTSSMLKSAGRAVFTEHPETLNTSTIKAVNSQHDKPEVKPAGRSRKLVAAAVEVRGIPGPGTYDVKSFVDYAFQSTDKSRTALAAARRHRVKRSYR